MKTTFWEQDNSASQSVNICIRHSHTNKERRRAIERFCKEVYRRILGPGYDNEKENWRILTNKEMYASVKKPTIIETIRLNRLHWFGHEQRMEENRIPKRVLYVNLGTTRLRGTPRNRWQYEVREDGVALVHVMKAYREKGDIAPVLS